jgi:thiol:disulfide interchange protein DsbC
MKKILLAPLLIATSVLPLAHAASAAKKPDPAAIKKTLETRYPQVHVVDIAPAPIAGLFEVYTGENIVYTNDTGDYLLPGPLIETATRRNLTVDRIDARNTIDFATLPLDKAIKTVKGNGGRTMAVFSDPDCPFCKELEKELVSVDNVTIYTFLFPITDLHPDAGNKARAIWCSADRARTWADWMHDGKAATAPADACKAEVIADINELGKKLRISSTPTTFLADGKRIGGTVPAADLEQALKASAAGKPQKTSALAPAGSPAVAAK